MSETSDKVRVTRISRPNMGSYVADDPRDVRGEVELFLSEDEPGDRLELELIEMSWAEYDALPEFQGW